MSASSKIQQDMTGLAWFEEIEVSHTTIKCPNDGCCGCLNAHEAKTERSAQHIDGKRLLIFICNECGIEAGRGDTAGIYF
jgi:hypothetical protein